MRNAPRSAAAIVLIVVLLLPHSNINAQSYSGNPSVVLRTERWGVLAWDDKKKENVIVIRFGETDITQHFTTPSIVGRKDYSSNDRLHESFRGCYRWDVANIPTGSRINNCTLEFWFKSYTDKEDSPDIEYKIKPMTNSNWSSDAPARWQAVGNAAAYRTLTTPVQSLPQLYRSVSITGAEQFSIDLKSAVESQTNFNFALMTSDDEVWYDSGGDENYLLMEKEAVQYPAVGAVKLTVNYSIRCTVIVKNSFNGGNVHVGNQYPASGTLTPWYSGDPLTIEAYAQTFNGWNYAPLGYWTIQETGEIVQGNPRTISPQSNCTYVAAFSRTRPVLVEQRTSTGALTSYGIKHWDNGTSFEPKPNPWPTEFTEGTDHCMLGYQDLYSGEKYRIWQRNSVDESDILNHHKFMVDATFASTLTSRLHPVNGTASVKIDLLENHGSYNGSIFFKDPWFIDYADPLYGNTKRNRGSDAEFYSRATPFIPDLTTPFGEISYQGVFLNQDYNVPGAPYYSIEAPSVQSNMNGYTGCFFKWDASGATVQNVSSPDPQGVVFKQANATVTALYKAHLGSNNASSTSGNGQRKIVFFGGRHHLVYPSSGEIWYTSSTDNGSTWSNEIRLSDGSGLNRTPHIAANVATGPDYPYIACVWERYDSPSNQSTILLSHRDNTTFAWEPPTEVANNYPDSPGNGAFPTLTMKGAYETVVWRVRTGYFDTPGIHMLLFDRENSNQYSAVVPGTNDNSSHPTSAEYGYSNQNWWGVVWSQLGAIKYVRAIYNEEEGCIDFSNVETVSAGTESSFEDHYAPSLTYELVTPYRPVVAWQAVDWLYTCASTILIRRRESNGVWGTITAYGSGGDFEPSIVSSLTSGDMAVAWHDEGIVNTAKYISGAWGARNGLSVDGIYPSLGYDFDEWPDQLRIAYTGTSGTVKAVGTTNESLTMGLQKTDVVTAPEQLERRIIGTSANGAFSLSLALKRSNAGSIQPVSFADGDVLEKADDAAGFFRSRSIRLGSSESLSLTIRANSKLEGVVLPDLRLRVRDAANGSTLTTVPLDLSKAISREWSISGKMLGNRDVLIDLAPIQDAEAKWRWTGVIVHSDTGRTIAPGRIESEPIEQITQVIPATTELLGNYPNPFNPATVVNYQLSVASQVSLRIFDMLGREVAVLVEGAKEAGVHTVKFNAEHLGTGTYFCRLTVTPEKGTPIVRTQKMILAK